jgi:hypothetical protein
MIPKDYKPVKSLRGQNEELVLLPFLTQPQANDRYYLPMNSELDNSLITGIETHSHTTFFGVFPYDLPAQVEINGVTYNVITGAELCGITITIVDKQRRQALSNYPAKALYNTFAPSNNVTYVNNGKNYTKFALSILSGECYITWNVNAVTATPFVLPISFIYDDQK